VRAEHLLPWRYLDHTARRYGVDCLDRHAVSGEIGQVVADDHSAVLVNGEEQLVQPERVSRKHDLVTNALRHGEAPGYLVISVPSGVLHGREPAGKKVPAMPAQVRNADQ